MSVPESDRLLTLFQRHADKHGFVPLADAAAVDAFIAGSGERVLLLAEEPRLVPESWDVAVILPDALAPVVGRVNVGLVLPVAAKALAVRYSINLWPALLFLRDGQFVGTLEGMRDWAVYAKEIPAMLERPVSRTPGIGIPVASATSSSCS